MLEKDYWKLERVRGQVLEVSFVPKKEGKTIYQYFIGGSNGSVIPLPNLRDFYTNSEGKVLELYEQRKKD